MSDLSTVVGGSSTITGADGKTYTMTPLNLADYGEIDLWIAEWIIKHATRIYGNAPEAVKNEGLKKAYADAEWASFANRTGILVLMRPEGVVELLIRALAKHHPTITRGDVARIVDGPVFQEIQAKLQEMNRIPDPSGGDSAGTKPGSPKQ